MSHAVRLVVALAIPAFLAACKKDAPPAPAANATAAQPAQAGQPAQPAQPAQAAPQKPAQPAQPAADLPAKMAASHILYAYKGGMRARPEVTRSKEEAQKAAEAALTKLKAGTKFEELASAESDCPSKAKGGDLGSFPSRMMHPKFSEAAAKLKDGELSGVVETPFGFHVIRRNALVEIRASHVLYMYKGGRGAPPSVTRSKEEAQKAAEAALAKIKGGSAIEEIAKAESDCPSKAKGGDLGSFSKGMMVPAFEQAAFALQVGQVADKIVESPFGFHVIKRTN